MESRIVIVGGGILGCSVAYHLARAGTREVLLVERNELASATTSCAAGLLGQLRATAEQAELVQRTLRDIAALECELGESPGFRRVGSVRIATTPGREREMAAQLALARAQGVEGRVIDKSEAQRLVPALDARQARMIGWIPGDGYADPYQLAMAYARSARARGVQTWTGTAVTGFRMRAGRVIAVDTDRGDVPCGTVVLAAGAWAGPVAALAGAALPVTPVRSHFWITAPHPAVRPDQPVVRFPDLRTAYTRPEVGGLLMGCYEPRSRAYDAWALGPGFTMREVDREWDVFLRHVGGLVPWFPFLEDAEMVGAMAGLPTFPPDGRYVIGRVPEVEGVLVASGCSGGGIAGSGGIGSVIAELVTTGRSSIDLTSFRADRFGAVEPRSAEFRRRCALARSAPYGGGDADPEGRTSA
jgi:sarcosine oxidase, subunit beta